MAQTTAEFWKLACQGRLFTQEESQRWETAFAGRAGPGADGPALAEFLVGQQALTRYQAKVLLAGRAGPFCFDDYKVFDRVESGPQKGLFRAVHMPTRHPVALHFLAGNVTADAGSMQRLGQRVTAAQGLRHVHLWPCHALVDLGAYKFVVTADAQGQSLETLLADQKALPPTEACRIGRQIAHGLAHLHASGQTHAAICPAHVWLDPAGNARLLHAPFTPEPVSPSKLPADRLAFMADYLAPELTGQDRAADAHADVYALGCLLYQMLCGRVPFTGGDAAQKARRHASEQPAALDKVNSTVPRTLAQVVEWAMAKDPSKRYPTAANLGDALKPYVPAAKAKTPPESVTAAGQAFEEWLTRPRAARPAAAVAVAATPGASTPLPGNGQRGIPTAQPVTVGGAPPVAVAQPVRPIAQPAMAQALPAGGYPTAVAAPVMAQPASGQPAYAQPAYAQPAYAQPAYAQPAYGQAVVAQGGVAELAIADVAGPSLGIAAERRLKQKRSGSGTGIMLALGLLLIVGGIGGYILWPKLTGGGNQPATTAASGTAVASAVTPAPPGSVKPAKVSLTTDPPVDENAERLMPLDEPVWQSPTKGAALDLTYLPQGAQVYIALRPAEILKHPEGPKVIEGLGPLAAMALGSIPSLSTLEPEKVELAIFGLGEGSSGGPPSVSLVVRAIEPANLEELEAAWGEGQKMGSETVYQSEGLTRLLPTSGAGKTIVAVALPTPDALKEYLQGIKKTPIRLKETEVLLRTSDADRHFTALFAPTFLLDDAADSVFAGPAAKLKAPFDAFLTDSSGRLPKACLFSVHLTESDLFLELRAHGTPTDEPLVMAKGYRDRVRDLKRGFKDHLSTFNPHDYGKKVLTYFPDMLEQVGAYTVAAADDKQAVVRCYLPAVAAHNLALAGQLAVLERGGGGSATAAVAAVPEPPKTLAEKLKMKISLGFPRNTLEKCMELFGEEIGAKVEILGTDLQLEGITKNQSFGLDEKDKPAFEILMSVMLKANPANKLVYVLSKEGDEEVLKITTRAAAAKRGDAIPEELKE
jgi:hypothetical protein